MESIMESIVNGMTKRARERSKTASPTESEENPFEALGKSERRTRFRQSDSQSMDESDIRNRSEITSNNAVVWPAAA
jgi:hypothetical protein